MAKEKVDSMCHELLKVCFEKIEIKASVLQLRQVLQTFTLVFQRQIGQFCT